MPSATLICQVGFWYKSKKEEVHFPTLGDAVIGYPVVVPTSDNPYSPYTYAELVSGQVPYDLLPEELKAIVDHFAYDAYEMLLEMKPSLKGKLNSKAVRVRFYEIMDSNPHPMSYH